MFKYISDIISKISMKQRLTALSIVLLSIVIISTAPKIVSSFTQDNEELKIKVENQRLMIIDLTKQVDTLNQKIISDQTFCTNRFVTREREVMDLLTALESEARNSNGKIVSSVTTTERREIRHTDVDETDVNGNRVSRMEMPSPPKEKTVVIKNDNTKLLQMISHVKNNVQNHIGN